MRIRPPARSWWTTSDPYLLSGSAYAVHADSSIRRIADVDRAGVTVGTVTGQSQATWIDEYITSARIHAIPAVPPNAGLAALLLDGTVDAFAANRTHMEEFACDFPAVRVLDDNFLVTSQAVVVARGRGARAARRGESVSRRGRHLGIRPGLDRPGEYPWSRGGSRRDPVMGGRPRTRD